MTRFTPFRRTRPLAGLAMLCALMLLSTAPPARGEIDSKDLASLQQLSRAFRAISREVTPSVVHIRTKKKLAAGAGAMNKDLFDMLPPEWRERFRERAQPNQPRFQRAQGSGVIIRANGIILTNNHVVDGADEILVILPDGRELKAKTLGVDPKIDVAVIQIEAKGLKAAKLGDSDKAEVGDWVVAVGNPFGLTGTVTAGIISAKGRSVGVLGRNAYEDFIQTDAAINPGNSGGPLVNVKGEVIGINTAIASRVGAYQGVGFAIPIRMIQEELEDLIAGREIVRGYLGVAIQDLEPGLAASLGLPDADADGALVTQVAPDSPAAKAELKLQDVIRALDGKPVKDVKQLRNRVARMRPDTKVKLGVVRAGKLVTLDLVIGRQPKDMEVAFKTGPGQGRMLDGEHVDEILGITVKSLSKAEAEKRGIPVDSGVLITKVETDSILLEREILVGDVIERVGDKVVPSAVAYRDAIKTQKLPSGIRLLVRSERGARRFVFVQKK